MNTPNTTPTYLCVVSIKAQQRHGQQRRQVRVVKVQQRIATAIHLQHRAAHSMLLSLLTSRHVGSARQWD